MFRMKSFMIIVASTFCLFVGLAPVVAQDAKLSDQDKTFMDKAAMGGMMEVQLGQMAVEKAGSQAVKEFGERMVADHSKANDKLKEIAQKANYPLPDALDKKHQETIQKLSGLSGKEFDRSYMDEMVKDHTKDVKAFKKQAEKGQYPDLKQFAATTVSTLEEHKKLAESIHQQLSGESKKKID